MSAPLTATLMDQYAEFLHADWELDDAVAVGTSGEDWWKEGGKGLPFSNWYFDTYDLSVELLGTKHGWTPTPENLAAYYAAGLRTVYVSYEGAAPDSTGKDSAWMWQWRDGSWKNGGCSARSNDDDKRELVGHLKREVARLSALLSTPAREGEGEGACRLAAFAALVEYRSHSGRRTHTDCMPGCLCAMSARMDALEATLPPKAVGLALMPQADFEAVAYWAPPEAVVLVCELNGWPLPKDVAEPLPPAPSAQVEREEEKA